MRLRFNLSLLGFLVAAVLIVGAAFCAVALLLECDTELYLSCAPR
jgi:hypothetical protein